jgi:hypothetical protein
MRDYKRRAPTARRSNQNKRSDPVSIVLSGDWQLQDRAWLSRTDLCHDSYFGQKQFVNYCVEHNLPLLALGDLTDSDRPGAYTVKALAERMRRREEVQQPTALAIAQCVTRRSLRLTGASTSRNRG